MTNQQDKNGPLKWHKVAQPDELPEGRVKTVAIDVGDAVTEPDHGATPGRVGIGFEQGQDLTELRDRNDLYHLTDLIGQVLKIRLVVLRQDKGPDTAPCPRMVSNSS